MNIYKIANKIADERLEGLVESREEGAAPASEYKTFFDQIDLPVVVVHLSPNFCQNTMGAVEMGMEFVHTYKGYLDAVNNFARVLKVSFEEKAMSEASSRNLNAEDTKVYVDSEIRKGFDVWRPDFEATKTLRPDCLNFVVEDSSGTNKSPGWIIHDFYHAFFERDVPENPVKSSHKYRTEDYLPAILNDYDFSEFIRKNGLTKESLESAMKEGLSSQTLGSFYNTLVSMIGGPDRLRGPAMQLVDTGADNSAWFDIYPDILPIYFNPQTRGGISLPLKPIWVSYFPPDGEGDDGNIVFRIDDASTGNVVYTEVLPKSNASMLSPLFTRSLNIILKLMDDYMESSIGKIVRVI